MGKLLSFFTGGWQGYLIAGGLAFLIGAGSTWRVMSWREEAHQTQTVAATARLVVHQAEIGTQLGVIYIPKFIFIETQTANNIAEIPKHVTPEIDRQYPVPLGFVRVFNLAAHGPIPGPAAGSDADPSGVPLSDVAIAHTEDQGTLDLCRKQNDEWWDWYDRNKAAFAAVK